MNLDKIREKSRYLEKSNLKESKSHTSIFALFQHAEIKQHGAPPFTLETATETEMFAVRHALSLQ